MKNAGHVLFFFKEFFNHSLNNTISGAQVFVISFTTINIKRKIKHSAITKFLLAVTTGVKNDIM